MPSLMLITPRLNDPPIGGRELLSRLHIDCIRELLGDDFRLMALNPVRSPPTQSLRGYVDGASPEAAAELVRRIERTGVTRIFLNGSNLGRLAKAVRTAAPSVEIFTFFHNVETLFFAGALRTHPSLRAAAVLIANRAAEKDAVRYSDRLIALNDRDSRELKRVYGRSATDILPMALEDRFEEREDLPAPGKAGDFLLFVGGDFYANRAGIRWFAREVSPKIALRTRVIGRGLDAYREELERSGRVDVLGAVDDLEPHYLDAAAVIAPIFGGSGMKTKVAEALMYGKRILGTDEAFCGYEQIAPSVGWICNAASEFVAAAAEVDRMKPQRFDRALRQIYESAFSHSAVRSRLASILGESR